MAPVTGARHASVARPLVARPLVARPLVARPLVARPPVARRALGTVADCCENGAAA
jgi:hypothetical protein